MYKPPLDQKNITNDVYFDSVAASMLEYSSIETFLSSFSIGTKTK